MEAGIAAQVLGVGILLHATLSGILLQLIEDGTAAQV
jgi:hypothetical protein